MKYLSALAFLSTILLANYVTTEFGLVAVGFGVMATAGTYLAGLAFVLRDLVQDTAGRWATVVVILVGACLSYLVADPFIALASGLAFVVSEVVDLAIYTPLRRRGYVRAAISSNLAGAAVDSVLFLTVAGFPLWSSLPGQMIGKAWITAAVVALVWGARAVLRQPVNAEGA